MPVQYDLPEYQNAQAIEDVNKYNKLPVWLAMLEARRFPEWQVFNQLFGKIDWKRNMGKLMRGVRAEHTPVGQQEFFPKNIDETPNKNVYETTETSEDAVLKLHDFDSKQFHFLPSFQDFRENQVDFAHKDIIRQIAISNDLFIRAAAFQKAPYVFIPANTTAGERQLLSAPVVEGGNITSANAVKNTAWFQAMVPKIGTNLTLAAIDYATAVMRDDLNAPFFEGTVNKPKDNELIKGKYVLLGSSEAYQMFKWDPNFAQFRNINLSIVNDGFRGSIFDEVTYKTERYPLRFKADGTRPAPEILQLDPAQGVVATAEDDPNQSGRVRPNPDYVSAPYEVAFLIGADAFKTIKIGPPPRAFSSKKLDMNKFYSMKWNGEVQLTDQVLIQYADGTYDTNVRGRFLKLISSVVMGMIPQNQYNFLPILFERARPEVV
jgi:hypothetical protein